MVKIPVIDLNAVMLAKEVSTTYGIAPAEVRRVCREGFVRCRKAGATWLVLRADCEDRWDYRVDDNYDDLLNECARLALEFESDGFIVISYHGDDRTPPRLRVTHPDRHVTIGGVQGYLDMYTSRAVPYKYERYPGIVVKPLPKIRESRG